MLAHALVVAQAVPAAHCHSFFIAERAAEKCRSLSLREEREALPQVSWLAPGVRRVGEHDGGVEYAGQHKATSLSEPAVGECEGGRVRA